MKYKLFISDYDGTLGLAPKNDIHPETKKAIEKFTKAGGIFTVCSGRETSSIERICREQGLKGVLVSFQGAHITDIESGKELFKSGLSKENALKAITDLEEYPLIPLVYTDKDFFYTEKNEFIQMYEQAVNIVGRVADVKDEVKKMNGQIYKICFLGEDEVVNAVAKKFNQKYQNKGLKFNSGSKFLLEVINPDCGKDFAVRFLADYYKVPLSQVIAVGDSTNDIDLISGNWFGVAVGDGREELKAVADEVTVPYNDNPVKLLIEKYCLD